MKPFRETVRNVVRWALREACQHYPFVSGQHYISSVSVLKWSCRGAGKVEAGKKGKDFICIDLNDASGRSSYFFGCNDGKVRNLIKSILRPADTFIDIGANYGSYSLLAASIVGLMGSVHAFEPQPIIAEMLRRSAIENGYSHIFVHEVALSDHDRAGALCTSTFDSGSAKLLPGGTTEDRSTVAIRVVHSGNYLAGLDLNNVKLIKIDVEDHEFEVISGALDFMKATPPNYIIFECNNPGLRFSQTPLVVLLKTLGFSRIYEVPHHMVSSEVRRLFDADEPRPHSINFLGIHDSVAERIFGE